MPPDVDGETYGHNVADTVELHTQHHRWAAINRQTESGLPPYDATASLVDETRLTRWKNTLGQFAAALMKPVVAERTDATFYHATLNLGQAAGRRQNQSLQGSTAPRSDLGPVFERAVIRRVHAWLEQAAHPAIQSAWCRVNVANAARPDRTIAEFDVLLVLKTGMLLHLECKSFKTEAKDLDARLFNFQQAGSRIARMAVCGPLFTGHTDQDWFVHQHEMSMLCRGPGRPPFIPFTLDGQPRAYFKCNADGTEERYECETFEEGLARLLSPYALRAP